MEAKTFLQYASGYSGIIPYHQDVCNFYSQPFQVEMIESLFEGNRHLSNDIFGIGAVGWVEAAPRRRIYAPMGKAEIPFGTLDQFVGDCQRFGIELLWSKEIVKKYFS